MIPPSRKISCYRWDIPGQSLSLEIVLPSQPLCYITPPGDVCRLGLPLEGFLLARRVRLGRRFFIATSAGGKWPQRCSRMQVMFTIQARCRGESDHERPPGLHAPTAIAGIWRKINCLSRAMRIGSIRGSPSRWSVRKRHDSGCATHRDPEYLPRRRLAVDGEDG
jgi:hypothetical protein